MTNLSDSVSDLSEPRSADLCIAAQIFQQFDKPTLRHCLRDVRKAIPVERRQEASTRLLSQLYPTLQSYRSVLSFASKSDEIDLWAINRKLAEEKRLLLPKIVGDVLEIFAIEDFETQLCPSLFSILEPIPERCQRISLDAIECILVPGLGFDSEMRRIGYGRGLYDRFLTVVKAIEPSVLTIGVGFQEQKVSTPIPTEPHDFPVDQLYFF